MPRAALSRKSPGRLAETIGCYTRMRSIWKNGQLRVLGESTAQILF